MKNIKLTLIAALTLFFAGCATTISTTVQRPAELNMNGAKSISVLPFQSQKQENFSISLVQFIFTDNIRRSDESNEIATYLTEKVTSAISSRQYYDLISSNAVKAAIDNSTELPCDVYLTGHLDNVHIDVVKHKKEVEEDGEKQTVIEYSKKISLTLVYEVIEAESQKVISHASVNISGESYPEINRHQMPRAVNIIETELDYVASQISKKIQPYYETVYLQFMEYKGKNPLFKDAEKAAKKGNLEASKKMFTTLYEEQNISEAGYNIAIICQAQGYYEEAKSRMEKIVKETGNSKAYTALAHIEREIEKKKQLEEQLSRF